MKTRRIVAGAFGLAGLVAAGMTILTWPEPDGGRWMFAAFTAMFAVFTWASARTPKPREETGTRFAPAWFFDSAILVLAVLIVLVIGSCIFGRK